MGKVTITAKGRNPGKESDNRDRSYERVVYRWEEGRKECTIESYSGMTSGISFDVRWRDLKS